MDNDELIGKLNEDLELEYRSIVQYIHHIATVKGAEFLAIVDELEKHVSQEVEHALTLARQIDFLGGTPSTIVPGFSPAASSEDALRQDLELEETQLDRYRERIEQATEVGLPDVSETISPLLEQTQDHVRDLRAALGH